ncbi:hypothetical protein ZWY2020_047720 [Hordeum vulgare]|nr:hypothetical protein ZWY2020_047720 [Hordeum vulgare]
MEWQYFRETTLRLSEFDMLRVGGMVHGLVCWTGWMYDQIVVLDTATFHLSLIHLPTPLKHELGESRYIKVNTIVSWFPTIADNDMVVERWVVYKNFPLHTIVQDLTGTSKMCQLYNDTHRDNNAVHPYVMPWPPSLVQSKVSLCLYCRTALFSQVLLNEDTEKEIVDESYALLRPTENVSGSPVSEITTMDAQLVTAREPILRMSGDTEVYMPSVLPLLCQLE